jgi:alpha-ketoglutarate-dependent taurine dioxygenase
MFNKNCSIPVIKPQSSNSPFLIDIRTLHNLLDADGVVILRDFDFDLESLENFTNIFCHNFHTPATRSQRKVSGDNYSTEVFPDNYTLLGHTEGSYRPNGNAPDVCFFMCVTPPDELGGDTTLADGIEFLAQLPQELKERFLESGITYEMHWEKERWQNEFFVANAQELQAFFSSTKCVKFTLDEKEVLHLLYTTEAITKSRIGQDVFAPAILAHLPRITHPEYLNKVTYSKPSNRVYFGDGEEISDRIINQLIDIYDSILYPHRWHGKDVLVIDNTRYLHGRTMTENDCDRKLISRFGQLIQI